MAGRHSTKRDSGTRPGSSPIWKSIALRVGLTALVLAAVIMASSLYFGANRTAAPEPGSSAATQAVSPTPSPTPAPANPTPVTPTPTSTTNTGSNGTGSSTTTSTSSSALAAGIYAAHIADLKSVVPAEFGGYDVRTLQISDSEIGVPLQPDSSGPQATVRSALVVISDKGSAAAAQSFVSGMVKAFSKNVMHATAGSAKGLFATDGQAVAAFRFARGRYIVEVLVTSATGAPSELKSEVLRLAGMMPASRP